MLDGILKMLVSVKLAQHLAQSFQQPMQPTIKTERYIPIQVTNGRTIGMESGRSQSQLLETKQKRTKV